MTTGDLKNNLRKLQKQLRAIHYPNDVDLKSLGCGITSAYLPIYHYAFLDYSQPLGAVLVNLKHDMFGKSDLKFVECMYKVIRELFGYKPPVTKDQFFSVGFAECKVIMCTQILSLVKNKHLQLTEKTVTGTRHGAVTKNPLSLISDQLAANPSLTSHLLSTNQNQLSSSKSISEGIVQENSANGPTHVNQEVGRSKSSQLRDHRKGIHASSVGQYCALEMPQVSVVREPMSNFKDSELKQTTAGDKRVASVTNQLRGSMGEAGCGTNKMVEGEEQKQDDFVLNMLFSVSQTMVDLVSRFETMNERLENIETTVHGLLERNVASSSFSDDRHVCSGNETNVTLGAEHHDTNDGNVSMTRNLNNILARLTLLENGVKYLNEKQHTVSCDVNLLVDKNQNNRSIDSDDFRQSSPEQETLVGPAMSDPEWKHSTDVSPHSLMLDAPLDLLTESSENPAVVGRTASSVSNLYSSIPDSLLTLDSSNCSSLSSAIPESPPASSLHMRNKHNLQADRIVAMLQSTQEMLQLKKKNSTLPS